VLLVLFVFVSGNKEISEWLWPRRRRKYRHLAAGVTPADYVLKRARRGEGVSRALIIGRELGQTLALVSDNRHWVYSVRGFLDPIPGNARVWASSTILEVALEQFVDQLFVTLPGIAKSSRRFGSKHGDCVSI